MKPSEPSRVNSSADNKASARAGSAAAGGVVNLFDKMASVRSGPQTKPATTMATAKQDANQDEPAPRGDDAT